MKAKMYKPIRELENRFICPSCGNIRYRGVDVTVATGSHRGFKVKVCQSEICIGQAAAGNVKNPK